MCLRSPEQVLKIGPQGARDCFRCKKLEEGSWVGAIINNFRAYTKRTMKLCLAHHLAMAVNAQTRKRVGTLQQFIAVNRCSMWNGSSAGFPRTYFPIVCTNRVCLPACPFLCRPIYACLFAYNAGMGGATFSTVTG